MTCEIQDDKYASLSADPSSNKAGIEELIFYGRYIKQYQGSVSTSPLSCQHNCRQLLGCQGKITGKSMALSSSSQLIGISTVGVQPA